MGDIAPQANTDLGVATRSSRYPLYVFWVLFAINFLNSMDRSVFSGAANIIGKELGLGLAELGTLVTAFTIINTLGAIPLGIWADRGKRKNIVAVSVAIWSLATAATAFATNFLSMLLARAVLGIGEAGYFPAGTALMSDYFSRSTRSRVMSWWNTGQLIGILVGVGGGGVIAGLYLGFLVCAPSLALMVTIHSFAGAGFFLFLTAALILMYWGPSTAATQDVVPSALRASAVAISILFIHLLGDAFAPQLVGVLAQWFDPTHGQHFLQSVAGNDLRLAFLITCVPALVIAGLVGIFGARWMKDDIAAAERADKLHPRAQAS